MDCINETRQEEAPFTNPTDALALVISEVPAPDQLVWLVRTPDDGWFWVLPTGNPIALKTWDIQFDTGCEAPRFKGKRRPASPSLAAGGAR